MVRHSFATFAFVALGFSRDPGCGGVDDPDGGTNAPCTRHSDCGGGLVCSEGVCREPDAGAPKHEHEDRDGAVEHDGAAPDAPSAPDAADDGG